MKTTKISITFESEKLSAIRMFNPPDSSGIEEQLLEQLEKLYAKIVPAPVRQYLESRDEASDSQKEPRKSKPV